MPVSTFTDNELLHAIQQNDERAFAELFRRYWKKVHHLACKSVRSEEVAQEIVQDLFISLWNKRASLSIHHLPSYLYSAVKNRALNHIASQTTQRRHWDYYKRFIPVQDIVTENDVEVSELLGALENEIEHLPEKTKKVFKLNILEGHSITEIAHTLNLSEKAIQYHLTQSIKKVRLHLKNLVVVVFLACLG